MEFKEQLEEQPLEKKPCIDNCQDEGGNSSNLNESELPKSAEGDKESTNLSSRRHRKLPAELNSQIYLCFNPATQRKFIWGLGWDFYAMFRHRLLTKTKRHCNPSENIWNKATTKATISQDGRNAKNSTNLWANVAVSWGGRSQRALP